jgi:hypothetical protein
MTTTRIDARHTCRTHATLPVGQIVHARHAQTARRANLSQRTHSDFQNNA